MSRILVFGGCFDPITQHHLSLLHHVMTKAAAGQLFKQPGWAPKHLFKPFTPFEMAWILPYNKDPNNLRELTPIGLRIEMIELAIKDANMEDYVQISDFEDFFNIDCGRTKALLNFSKFYHQNDFTFLLGVDESMDLRFWKDSRQLTRKLKFLVANRRNSHKIARKKRKKYTQTSDWYHASQNQSSSYYIQNTLVDNNMDGEFIRNKLASEAADTILYNNSTLTQSVIDFIKEHNLYV